MKSARAPAWAVLVFSGLVWISSLTYLALRPFAAQSPVSWGALFAMFAVVLHWFGGAQGITAVVSDLQQLASALASQVGQNPQTASAAVRSLVVSPDLSSSPAPSPKPSAPLASSGSGGGALG